MSDTDIKELSAQVHQLELKLAMLPGEIGAMIDDKCITRREFKLANTLISVAIAILGGLLTLKGLFIGKA